jgi:hypothetical protein
MSDTIQLITSVGALLLGAAYVIGGLIVNLHLSRYGVTEYQVLRVKYLVVGLIYLASFVATIPLSWLILVLFSLFAPVVATTDILIAFSLIAVILLGLLGIYRSKSRTLQSSRFIGIGWTVFALLTALSLDYPLRVSLFGPTPGSPEQITFRSAMVIVIGILSLMGQIFYYSRYLYGNSNALDSVGMGIPVKVKLAGTEENITLLEHMGLPTQPPDMTAEVLLIDETDSHYILGTGANPAMKVYKIDKALIKGIVYL